MAADYDWRDGDEPDQDWLNANVRNNSIIRFRSSLGGSPLIPPTVAGDVAAAFADPALDATRRLLQRRIDFDTLNEDVWTGTDWTRVNEPRKNRIVPDLAAIAALPATERPNGATFFVVALLATVEIVGGVPTVSNSVPPFDRRNLADNPDYAVWQANPTGAAFTPAGTGYVRGPDRWKTYNTAAASTTFTRVAPRRLKVQRVAGTTSAAGGLLYFGQDFAPGSIAGRQITVTVPVKAGANASAPLYLNDYGLVVPASTTVETVARITYTPATDAVLFYVPCTGTAGADDSYTFGEVTIAVGPVAVPFSPPDPEIETFKAWRRFRRIDDAAYLGFGLSDSTSTAAIDILFGVPMVAAPAITIGALSGSPQFILFGGTTYTPASIVGNGASKYQAALIVNAGAAPFVAGKRGALYTPPVITFDSGAI